MRTTELGFKLVVAILKLFLTDKPGNLGDLP